MGHRRFNFNPDELTTCQICQKKVKLKNILHHNRKHFWNAKGPYVCFVCGKKFTRKKYSIHIQFEHQEATGKFYRPTTAPAPKTSIVKIDFVKELKRMRGNQNWTVLKKRKFALLYDDVNHTPVGGLEHLTKADLQDNIGDERAKFYQDPEVSNPVPPNGFSTFNRVQGHVVPSRNYRLRPEDNYDTQSTANTIPQLFEVNNGAVHQVEDLQRDLLLLDFWDEGIFLTGPIYDRTSPKHAAINNLLVYDLESTFKISLVRREGEQPRLQVFIIPNDYSGMPFWYHRSTIEEVERRTGLRLDLFRECLYMWNQLVEVHRCRLSGCDACFADKQGLSNHLQNHLFRCTKCRKNFPTNEARKAHIKENHRKQPCKICGKVVYGSKVELTDHMRTHSKEKPFSCPLCDFKTANRGGIRQHLKQMHSNERNHICDTCGHASKTAADLRLHKRTHLDIKIPCPICGANFRLERTLKQHMLEKHDPNFVPKTVRCETCWEECKGKRELGHHVNKVHRKLPYVCTCGNTYSCQKTLSKHQKKCNLHQLSSSTTSRNVANSQNEVVTSPNQLVKPGATSQIHSVSESSNADEDAVADVPSQNGRKITSNDPVISRPASVSPPPSSTSSSPLAAAASVNQLVKCMPTPSSISQDDLQTDGCQTSSSSQQITTVRIRRRPDPSKKRKILSRNRSNKRKRVIEDDDDEEYDSDNQGTPVNSAASCNQPVSKRPSSPPGSSGSKDMLQPSVITIDDDDEDEPAVSQAANVPSATPASSTMTSANYVPSSNQLVSVSDALKMLMSNRGGQLLPPQPRKRATPGAYSLSKAAIKRGKYSDPKQPKLMVFMGEEEKNEKEEKNKKEKDKKERKKKK